MRNLLIVPVLSLLCTSYSTRAERPAPARNETVSDTDRSAAEARLATQRQQEREFYTRLLSEAGNDELKKVLGVFGYSLKDVPNPASSSLRPKSLGFCGRLEAAENTYMVFIFEPHVQSWPGNQPIQIVLTDSKYHVLDWLTTGGEPQFSACQLPANPTGRILEVIVRMRLRGIKSFGTLRYSVKDDKLVLKRSIPLNPAWDVRALPSQVEIAGKVDAPGRYVIPEVSTVTQVIEEAGAQKFGAAKKVSLTRGDSTLLLDLMNENDALRAVKTGDRLEVID